MKRRLTFLIVTTCAILVLAYGVRGKAQQPPASASQPAAEAHQAVLSKYCYTCHNDKVKSGGLALTTLDISAPAKDSEAWERVVRKLETGAMPPAGRPRPDKATADSLVRYLETDLDRAALANPNPGSPGLQRLNRAEYKNAIRDLLALDIDVTSMLPPDTASFGFDNNADALTLSPALTERYLSAAAKISQVALTRPRGIPTPETFFEPTDRSVGTRVSDEMPFGTRGGIALHYLFPADGDYLIETRPKENGANDGFENFSTEVHQLDIAIDSVKVWSAGLGGPEWTGTNRLGPQRAELERKTLDQMKFTVHVKAGEHLVQAYFVRKTATIAEDLFDPSLRREPYRAVGGMPKLSYLRITGTVDRDGGNGRHGEPPPRAHLWSLVGDRRDMRQAHHLDARAPRLSSSRDRHGNRSTPGAVSRRRQAGWLRIGRRNGAPQHPGEPEIPFPGGKPATGNRAEHGVSAQRHRLGVAAVLLHLEQHSRRNASRPGRERSAASTRGDAATGPADAGRPEIAGARRQLRGSMAPRPQCSDAPAESRDAVPLRRQPA